MTHPVRPRFHISQQTVPRATEHPVHHRPLLLLLILMILCQQFGIFSSFAAAILQDNTSEPYTYTRYMSTVDDSWIGLPEQKKSSTSPYTSTTPKSTPQKNGVISLLSPGKVQKIDDSWLFPTRVKQKPSTSLHPMAPTNPIAPLYTASSLYPSTPITQFVTVMGNSYPSGSNSPTISNTDALPEGTTNLYFTDARAQSALSGMLMTQSGGSTLFQSQINTLSQTLSGTQSDIIALSGAIATKIGRTDLSATGGVTYDTTTGIFSWNGTTDRVLEGVNNLYYTTARFASDFIARFQTAFDTAFGLKKTDDLGEGSINLYFTDARAQNALSGSIANIGNTINNLSGSLSTLITKVDTLSGSLQNTNTLLSTLSGTVGTLTTTVNSNYTMLQTQITTNSTQLSSLFGTVSDLSTSLASLSGSIASIIADLESLSGVVVQNTADISTLSGNLSTVTNTLSNLSTTVQSLSGTVDTLVTTINSNYTTLSTAIANINTDLATTNANLATATGSIASLSGSLATTNANLTSLSGTVTTLQNNLSTLSGQVATLEARSHDAVTLANANGLSISGQVLSLALASGSSTGALSAIDWNTFNSKQNAIVQATTTASGWLSSADWNTFNNKINLTSLSVTGGLTYNNTTGLFGWNGTTSNVAEGSNLYYTTARQNTDFDTRFATKSTTNLTEGSNLYYTQSRFDNAFGLKNTDLLTEGTTNLYFTDTRAQNALSGSITNIGNTINTLSGSLSTLITTVDTLSGVVSINYVVLSGALANTDAQVSNLSGTVLSNFNTLSGTLASLTSTVQTLSGTLASLTSTVQTLSGSLANTNTTLANTINSLTDLSGTVAGISTTMNTLSGSLSSLTSTVSSLSGTVSALSATVSANFATLSGSLATEIQNRTDADTTLQTQITNTSTQLSTLSGTVTTLQNNLSTLSGQVATLEARSHDAVTLANANGLSISGQVLSLALASGSSTGALSAIDWNTFNNKINLTSLSATGGLTYNNTTGLFGWNGTTSNVAEGSNLYYTTTRQNADFDTRFAIKSTTNLTEGTNLYYTQSRFDNAFGLKNTDLLTEGTTNLYFTPSRAQNALSGSIGGVNASIAATNANLATATGSIATLSSNLATTNSTLSTLSGVVATKIGLTSLSVTGPLTYNNTTGVFAIGQATTSTNGYLSSIDWNTFNSKQNAMLQATTTASGWLSSIDWNTFNNKQGIISIGNPSNGLSLSSNTLSLALASGSSTGALSSIDWNTFNSKQNALTFGNITTATSGVSITNGTSATVGPNVSITIGNATSTANGLLTSTDWNTFNSKIGIISGTPNGLSISGTGISLALASGSSTGSLSAIDWNTFNNKINFTSLSATGGLTYNNTTGQFGDLFSFSNGLTRNGNVVSISSFTGGQMSGFTSGQAVFGSPTGGLEQSSNFFWDNTNGRLGIGTNAPVATFHVQNAVTSGIPTTASGILAMNALTRFRSSNSVLSFLTDSNTPYGIGFQAHDANTGNPLPLLLQPTFGSVGIGIINPSAQLHVQNNTITTSNLMNLTASGLTTGNALQIFGMNSRSLLRVAQETTDPLDVERVTIGQGGVSATKPDSLARDQLYVFGRINSSWDHYSADFLGADATRTTTDGTTAEGLVWDSVGITPRWSATSVVGISGSRRIALSATINASAFLGNYTITESTLNPVYESRAIINAANATTRALVGFTDRIQNATTLATDTNNSTNEIFFRKKAGTTTWETVTRSTANATEVVTATTVPVNQWNIFRIEVSGTAQTVKFFINGTLVATHTGTTIPASGIQFGHQIGLLVSAATLNTMDIDYIRVWSDDPPSPKVTENIPGTSGYVSDLFPEKNTETLALPIEVLTTQNTLKILDTALVGIGTGSTESIQGLLNTDTPTDSIAVAFLRVIKRTLEKLSDIYLDMKLSVRALFAKEVKTEKLCIGETCITEKELKEILESRAISPASSSASSVVSSPIEGVASSSGSGLTHVATSTESGAVNLPVVSSDTGSVTPIPEPVVPTVPIDTIATPPEPVAPVPETLTVPETTTPPVDTTPVTP